MASDDALREEVQELRQQMEVNGHRLDALADQFEILATIVLGDRKLGAYEGNDDAPLVEQIEEKFDEERQLQLRELRKARRRLTAVEEELGIEPPSVEDFEHFDGSVSEMTKLSLVYNQGVEAVIDNPSKRHHLAHELLTNWERWGEKEPQMRGTAYTLASVRDDLRTRLEDARDEDVQWKQVYDAMELIEKWSEGTITLAEGQDDEGKYVLERLVQTREDHNNHGTDAPVTVEGDD